jgi:hypothetical protein
VGAPRDGQIGQPGCSNHRGSSDLSELGPARGLARQGAAGRMGGAGGFARSARFSSGAAGADLGCSDGPCRRRIRCCTDVGIATAAAWRSSRAELGRAGPTGPASRTGPTGAGGGRARSKLGCAGATGRSSRAELGRAGATVSACGRTSAGTPLGRIGARSSASRRSAGTSMEFARGAVVGPAQARQPDPAWIGFGQLGRATPRSASGADCGAVLERARSTLLGSPSARTTGMGAAEDRGACGAAGTVVVGSIPRRGATAMDPAGARSNSSLVVAGRGARGTRRTRGTRRAVRGRVHG